MTAHRLAIPDVVLFEPKVFADARGTFFESFSQREFEEATGLSRNFVQDNHSISAKGVLRGLHYQLPPHAQGKLVRVVAGAVMTWRSIFEEGGHNRTLGGYRALGRQSSPALDTGNAHGFVAPEDGTEFLYKATGYATERAASSGAIRGLALTEIETPIISDKDKLSVL